MNLPEKNPTPVSERPYCATRGLLHGGRAICGYTINSSRCGLDGECTLQSKAERKPLWQAEKDWAGAIVVRAQDYDELAAETRELKAQLQSQGNAVEKQKEFV